MKLPPDAYCPALGWRQGEYQALLRLADGIKDRIYPIIIVPPIEYDFEERRPKRTVAAHIEPFARRLSKKWHGRFAWVGIHPELERSGLSESIHATERIFSNLRAANAIVAPVCNLSDTALVSTQAAIIAEDRRGCAIRATLEDFMRPTFSTQVTDMTHSLGVAENEVDFVLDLLTPAYEPYGVFAKILSGKLKDTRIVQKARNFVLLGSAIPSSFKDISVPGGEVIRHDWLFYLELLKQLPAGTRRPIFGDYTTVPPGFVVLDMRKIKVSGKVVYADQNKWLIRKGGAFRLNPEQMHGHCEAIVGSAAFAGDSYCDGDDYIAKCARREEGPSTLTRWKQVGINHHITLTADQISNLGA